MSKYTINKTPQQILPGWQDDTALYNGGTHTIYLANDPTVSPLTGYPLAPGVTITWKASQAIWAVMQTINQGLPPFPGNPTFPEPSTTLIVSPAATAVATINSSRLEVCSSVGTFDFSLGTWFVTGPIETTSFATAVWSGTIEVGSATGMTFTDTAFYYVGINYYDIDPNGNLFRTTVEYNTIWSIIGQVGNVYTMTVPLDSGKGRYAFLSINENQTNITSVTFNGKLYGSFVPVSGFRYTNSDYPISYRLFTGGFTVSYSDNTWAGTATYNNLVGGNSGILECRSTYVDIAATGSIASGAGGVLAICDVMSGYRYGSLDTSSTTYKVERNIPVGHALVSVRANSGNSGAGQFTLFFHD